MSTQSLRTLDEARAWLERHGVSASEWARVHGFAPTVVFSVLSGRTRGRRGQAHAVAVALQIKEAASKCESSPLALSVYEDRTESRRAVPLSDSKGATMT
jgi:gp16 family phage-associated protein